jgi:hypothetical protein
MPWWCWPGEPSVGRGVGPVGGAVLAGDQSGDRPQDGVKVLASAEVTGQGPPVGQVADAVLHTDPLRRMSPTFGLVRRGDRGRDRQLVLSSGRPA